MSYEFVFHILESLFDKSEAVGVLTMSYGCNTDIVFDGNIPNQ